MEQLLLPGFENIDTKRRARRRRPATRAEPAPARGPDPVPDATRVPPRPDDAASGIAGGDARDSTAAPAAPERRYRELVVLDGGRGLFGGAILAVGTLARGQLEELLFPSPRRRREERVAASRVA